MALKVGLGKVKTECCAIYWGKVLTNGRSTASKAGVGTACSLFKTLVEEAGADYTEST